MKTVCVVSGKGGVGKSTISQALAYGLAQRGKQVGLLDGDVRNPSVPTVTATSASQLEPGDLLKPIPWHGVAVFSLALLPILEDTPIMLDDSDIATFLIQCFESVQWPELDFLVVDLRPSAVVEIETLARRNSEVCAVVVTTPEKVAVQAVARTVRVLQEQGIPILGVVENKAEYRSGDDVVYSGHGGQDLADHYSLQLLARVPFSFDVMKATDAGEPVVLPELGTLLEMLAPAPAPKRRRGERKRKNRG
jgi:ATP-binding protein involved in chromosome partitioning